MKHAIYILILLILLSSQAFAQGSERSGGVGNGGSGDEAALAAEESILYEIVLKIKVFFVKNPKLAEVFPEFTRDELLTQIRRTKVEVTNQPVIDRHRRLRTCINDADLIRCNYEGLQKIKDEPKAIIVLAFHELLGLIGVEETSPKDLRIIDGYSISKKLASFIVKTTNYDLDYSARGTSELKQFLGNFEFESGEGFACANRLTISTNVNSSIDIVMMSADEMKWLDRRLSVFDLQGCTKWVRYNGFEEGASAWMRKSHFEDDGRFVSEDRYYRTRGLFSGYCNQAERRFKRNNVSNKEPNDFVSLKMIDEKTLQFQAYSAGEHSNCTYKKIKGK